MNKKLCKATRLESRNISCFANDIVNISRGPQPKSKKAFYRGCVVISIVVLFNTGRKFVPSVLAPRLGWENKNSSKRPVEAKEMHL